MGRRRAELLALNPEVRELVIGNRGRGPAEDLAASVGGTATSIEGALRAHPDAVVVTVGTAGHREILSAALELGVPVFCEKPLTAELAASLSIAAEAVRRRVPLQVGYHRRFDAAFVEAREAVASGQLGALYSASLVSFDHYLPRAEFLAGSGGTWRDLHVHDFDLARWVTGLEILSVCAVGSVRADDEFRAYADADTTGVVGAMTGDVLLTVRGARHDARGQDVRLELMGSGDSVVAGLDRRSPLRALGPGEGLFGQRAYDDFLERFAPAFAAETAAFVEVALGRRENPCPPSEDLAALRIALACERSVASGSLEAVEGTPAVRARQTADTEQTRG
jgi:myo-inositol 2-dehydrogenase/D-chiro-inositol 1-dehydrogenase